MSPAAPRHISVLGREAVEMLDLRDGGIYVDATFGAGGYSRAILAIAGTRVIGIDRDRSAITGGFDLVDAVRRPADPGRGPILQPGRCLRRARRQPPSMAS